MSQTETIHIAENDASKDCRPVTSEDVARYLPIVRRIVAEFARRVPPNVDRDDLFAAGALGLLNALRTNNQPCQEMFLAYVKIRVRGSIVDELRRGDWIPRRRRAQQRKTGEASVSVVSIDDLPPGTSFAASQPGPHEDAETGSIRAELRAAVCKLPTRERMVIEMRYFDDVSSKGIALALGLSEARVSQLHAQATRRLRTDLADEGELMAA